LSPVWKPPLMNIHVGVNKTEKTQFIPIGMRTVR
jgi:hypothetical protein